MEQSNHCSGYRGPQKHGKQIHIKCVHTSTIKIPLHLIFYIFGLMLSCSAFASFLTTRNYFLLPVQAFTERKQGRNIAILHFRIFPHCTKLSFSPSWTKNTAEETVRLCVCVCWPVVQFQCRKHLFLQTDELLQQLRAFFSCLICRHSKHLHLHRRT